MPNDNQDNERTGISRREFASRVGLAAAAAVVGPALHAAPLTGARVRGANDRVVWPASASAARATPSSAASRS